MADFGTDLSCTDDLDPLMGEVSGLDVVRQAVHRRLTTRRGKLIDDLNYGIDVRDYLSEGITPDVLAQFPSVIDAELVKDEMILSSVTSAAWNAKAAKLTPTITLETAAGPFSFVLDVTKVTVEILNGGA